MDIFKEPVKARMDCSDFIPLMSIYGTKIYGTKMCNYNPDEIIDIKVLDDNNRVVKVKFADGYVVKNVRDEEDAFDIDECLYLALAKKLYRKEYTYEGILHMVEELKYKKDAVSIVKHEEWDEFYMGRDGSTTYYIDMVERKFAKSSTAPMDKRYDLLDSVDDMFNVIRMEKQ